MRKRHFLRLHFLRYISMKNFERTFKKKDFQERNNKSNQHIFLMRKIYFKIRNA